MRHPGRVPGGRGPGADGAGEAGVARAGIEGQSQHVLRLLPLRQRKAEA